MIEGESTRRNHVSRPSCVGPPGYEKASETAVTSANSFFLQKKKKPINIYCTLAEDPETSIQVLENSAHAVRMKVM